MDNSAAFPPSPFDPPDPSRPRGGRSLKPWLIAGAGAVVLFFLVAGLALIAKQNALLAWTMTTLEQRIEARLPEDLPTDARSRLSGAFQSARSAIEAGKFDLFALERAQTKLLSASTSADPVSAEEVTSLADALDAIALPEKPKEPAGE